jgi:hypothetical protein
VQTWIPFCICILYRLPDDSWHGDICTVTFRRKGGIPQELRVCRRWPDSNQGPLWLRVSALPKCHHIHHISYKNCRRAPKINKDSEISPGLSQYRTVLVSYYLVPYMYYLNLYQWQAMVVRPSGFTTWRCIRAMMTICFSYHDNGIFSSPACVVRRAHSAVAKSGGILARSHHRRRLAAARYFWWRWRGEPKISSFHWQPKKRSGGKVTRVDMKRFLELFRESEIWSESKIFTNNSSGHL